MGLQRLTVLELAPAADELWEMDQDPQKGYLWHEDGAVAFPDVASGAKLRPRVTAAYASGKATNIARVFDAFLRPQAATPLSCQAQTDLAADLVTFLPQQSEGYHRSDIPGPILSQFTPGGAYMACLQARDLQAVNLHFAGLPPTEETQVDRRCANLRGSRDGEMINFSPYLYWEPSCVEAVLQYLATASLGKVLGLAGSLPLVQSQADPSVYAAIISAARAVNPQLLVSLDVGGAPLQACLEAGPEASPDVVCVNADEYRAIPRDCWQRFPGVAVVHDRRGCWILRGEDAEVSLQRQPDVLTAPDAKVVHTICAGDAAHGGLLLGLMLYGTTPEGLVAAVKLSQACALTVVESEHSIRGLTAETVERNLPRIRT